ncbi:MAG: ATP-dependent Clp protease ATP-binding subunit [Lewinella sp.]|nr:ATP-dependent Clp protease ATP-binding subunit [Lewinella sp.]
MTIPVSTLNPASKLAIEIAQKLAKEANHATFGPPHLLMALLNSRVGIASFISLMDKDLSYLKGWAQYRIDEYRAKGLPTDEPEADDKIHTVLDVAKTFMLMFNQVRIEPLSILCALTRPEVGFPKGNLGSLRLTEEELVEAILKDKTVERAMDQTEVIPSGTPHAEHSPANTKMFLQYCIDKIALAKQGKIDPIFGRDKEIREMENILCRRTKPNVIVTGEPGVGKTALVDGFALKIAEGAVSEYFRSAKLYQLDIGALVAGASYRGEVEDRLKKILQEIKRMDRVILFIDEIHIMLESNGGASGIANLLKPELARGELNVIGATTTKEYRMHIEKDPAFSRRFDVLPVEEPDIPNAIKMVGGLKELFETHHQFQMGEEAVSETVKMAKRYFPQRFLPDSAIDLMDRTMASFRILEDNMGKRIEQVRTALDAAETDQPVDDWSVFWEETVNVLSPLALEDLELEAPAAAAGKEAWTAFIDTVLSRLEKEAKQKKEDINKSDISKIVAIATGIPTGKIQGDEQQKLMELEQFLMAKVIGQDYAAQIIAKAIRRSRSGLKEKGKPIGSFFLVGPTGTGKTELAKTLTEILFNDPNNMIRFDMSEYMESHTVSQLKGSPRGYVGYGEGGLLVDGIRSKPYSVVLFDEVEKAHPDVFKLLLQVLDEGHLHDTLGKKGTFTDAVIIFTSNAESEWVVDQFEKGEVPKESEIRDRMVANGHFRPEFLNRLDAIIPFSPLSKEDLLKILDIQLGRVARLLTEQNLRLELTPIAKAFLTDKGYSPAFGARPLKRVIDTYLGDRISEMIISGELQNGATVYVDQAEDTLTFEPKNI